MKKLLLLFILLFISFAQANYYKVLKITDGDTFYIDFNSNNKIDHNERVRVNGIDAFEVKLSKNLEYQAKNFNLTNYEALRLGYLAKVFAEEKLLNKLVKIEYSTLKRNDKYNRPWFLFITIASMLIA